jgi:hypothetical protein
MNKNKEIQVCSICEVSELDTPKFYYNSKHGKNLCNKHYLQLNNNGEIRDFTKPNINDKRVFWTIEEETLLKELIEKAIPYKEIAIILHKAPTGVADKVIRMGIETKYKNSVKFKAIYQEYDWCYQKYMIEGLNHDEMAKEAKCSKRVIEKWCSEIHRLTQEFRQIHKQLNNKQKDLIVGSMLGDGHIDKREDQPMFIEVHAENQKDYLYYKYEILKDLCNISPVRNEACYREFNGKSYLCQPSYRLCTRIYNCLLEYRGKSYTYLLNLMNEFSFSIWMLDDAYRGDSNWTLCIAEYTPDDVQFAINKLKTQYGLNSWLQKDNRYLIFDASSSRKIDDIILKNIPNDLDIIKYKITENLNLREEEKRIYITHNNEELLFTDFCHTYDLDYKSTWQKVFRDNQNISDIIMEGV